MTLRIHAIVMAARPIISGSSMPTNSTIPTPCRACWITWSAVGLGQCVGDYFEAPPSFHGDEKP